ncbi:carbohydrate ABC transporter permease [Paenibacillus sepulcri]|uniref:Carbohydrate ABC transporter permease n=1 Tax=Paenibacillus sepulcri TaxID=359917 RepID=A0ABS7BYE4_9BACL|nr:carbohydrate ABC transporter permease [Paenibacillus sepulcri]
MRNKRSAGDLTFHTLNYLVFAILALLCIFPFYYLFINTISNNDLSSRGLISFYPRELHFTNYIEVLQIPGFGQAAFMSLSRTVLGTVLTVGGSALLGFIFTKREMWGRTFWYRFVVVTMYFNAGIIPWYITMMNLHMTNNFLAYIIPGVVSPFFVILVKTFVESLPIALQESAMIDGAGYWIIFTRIVFPLITPILATIAIFSAVGQWNSFTDTLFLMANPKLYTLQFVLYKYINEANSLAAIIRNSQGGGQAIDLSSMQTPTSIRTTVTMIVVFPILLVYPYFQRYFVKGIMIGAVKG